MTTGESHAQFGEYDEIVAYLERSGMSVAMSEFVANKLLHRSMTTKEVEAVLIEAIDRKLMSTHEREEARARTPGWIDSLFGPGTYERLHAVDVMEETPAEGDVNVSAEGDGRGDIKFEVRLIAILVALLLAAETLRLIKEMGGF